MGIMCPYCDCHFKILNELFVHCKLKHSLYFNRSVKCKQPFCLRLHCDYYSLKKHIRLKHTIPVDDHDNDDFSNSINSVVCEDDNNINTVPLSPIIQPSSNSIIQNMSQKITFNDVKNSVHSAAISFLAKLHANPNISRSAIQGIVNNTSELFGSCGVHLVREVLKNKNVYDSELDEILNTIANPFKNLQTEHLRKEFFSSTGCFIKPQRFIIDTVLSQKIQGEKNIHVLSNCTGEFISMRQVLKRFLELPNVYKFIDEYMCKKESESLDKLDSFLKGTLWRELKLKFINKKVFPLTIYFDELEINNPLGSHISVDKIGVVYYKITSLPPEYASKIENIFLALIHRTMHREDSFGNSNINEIFKNLINELKYLANEGLEILTENGRVQVYFTLAIVCGDNLGIHYLLGLNESFNSIHYCRFCREPKSIMQKQTVENTKVLRTVKNYNDDLKDLTCGIKRSCLFHELPNFHLTKNLYADIMHDLLEGVLRYEIPIIINSLINEKNSSLSLSYLNNRMQNFNYGRNVSNKNIPLFTENNLKNGLYICSASEMLTLLNLLSLMIGHLIPCKSQPWQLFLKLKQISSILFSNSIDGSTIQILNQLITDHHKLFLKLYKGTLLKPKFHFMLHYARILHLLGPLLPLSCMRFEANHRDLHHHAQVIKNRKNICYSLALINQFILNERFLSQKGFEKCVVSIGPTIEIERTDLDKRYLVDDTNINFDLSNTFVNTSWAMINSIKYMKNMILKTNEVNKFGKIKYILVDEDNVTFLISLLDVSFEEHYHANRIITTEMWSFLNHRDLIDPIPRDEYAIANGKNYIIC